MACVTLDQIASGCFVLGLGSSAKGVVERWHGVTFSRPIERTREYVEIVKRVAKGDQLDYSAKNNCVVRIQAVHHTNVS